MIDAPGTTERLLRYLRHRRGYAGASFDYHTGNSLGMLLHTHPEYRASNQLTLRVVA